MRSIARWTTALFALSMMAASVASFAAYNRVEKPLYAGQHILIGKLVVEQFKQNNAKYLRVTYDTTSSNWGMTATHLYVSKNQPTKAAPGRFPFKHEGLDNVKIDTFEIPLSQLLCDYQYLYIAAHADVCEAGECVPDFAATASGLPTSLTPTDVGYNWLTAEFTLSVNGVSYLGWCVDESAPYPLEAPYDTLFVPSYLPDGSPNPAARDLLGQQIIANSTLDPLTALNYLLNQPYVLNCSDPDFEYSIQRAIWFFTNSVVFTDDIWAADTTWVIQDVLANAPNYTPKCGDLAVVVLDPERLTNDPTNPGYLNNNQHFAIAVPLAQTTANGNCETAWARGTKTFCTGWGSYFKYTLQ
jgi:hypothetical protein